MICLSSLTILLVCCTKQKGIYTNSSDALISIPFLFILALGISGHSSNTSGWVMPAMLMAGIGITVIATRHLPKLSIENVLYWSSIICSGTAIAHLIDFSGAVYLIETETDLGDPLRYALGFFRIFGGVAQKNVFSTLLATSALIGFFWLTLNLHTKQRYRWAFGSAALAINNVTVGLLGSLTGFLGLSIGFLLLCWCLRTRIAAYRHAQALVVLFVVSFFAAWGMGKFGFFKENIKHINPPAIYKIDSNNKSIHCRLEFLKASFDQFAEAPILGEGLNTYSAYQINFSLSNPQSLAKCRPATTHPHNAVALIAAETGVVGLALMLVPFCVWVIFNLKANIILGAGLTAPILFHSQTEMPLNVSMVHWLMLILVFVYLSHDNQLKVRSNKILSYALIVGSFGMVFFSGLLLFKSHTVGVELLKIQNLPPRLRLEKLIQSPERNNIFFQWRFDQLIGKDGLELAVALKNQQLAKEFLPIFKRGISGAAVISDQLLVEAAENLDSR